MFWIGGSMKKIFLISILLTACSSYIKKSEVFDYAQDHIDLYMDLCMESSSGYEDMSASDAHYEGVVCAMESMKGLVQ